MNENWSVQVSMNVNYMQREQKIQKSFSFHTKSEIYCLHAMNNLRKLKILGFASLVFLCIRSAFRAFNGKLIGKCFKMKH